jgi:hypothetical protein
MIGVCRVTAKYLLPCACGRQSIVEPRQAGQTIVCPCGASLDVPTMRDITALEPAPDVVVGDAPAQAVWGRNQRLLFQGIVIVLAAILGGVWLYIERPRSRFETIDAEQIKQTAKGLSPVRTWEIWETMKQGLDRRTDEQYAEAMLRFRAWQVVVGIAALLGVTLIVVGAMGARGAKPQAG